MLNSLEIIGTFKELEDNLKALVSVHNIRGVALKGTNINDIPYDILEEMIQKTGIQTESIFKNITNRLDINGLIDPYNASKDFLGRYAVFRKNMINRSNRDFMINFFDFLLDYAKTDCKIIRVEFDQRKYITSIIQKNNTSDMKIIDNFINNPKSLFYNPNNISILANITKEDKGIIYEILDDYDITDVKNIVDFYDFLSNYSARESIDFSDGKNGFFYEFKRYLTQKHLYKNDKDRGIYYGFLMQDILQNIGNDLFKYVKTNMIPNINGPFLANIVNIKDNRDKKDKNMAKDILNTISR